MPEKTKRGDHLGYFNIHSVAKHQKIEGGPFGEKNFFEKKVTMPKKLKGGPFSLSRWYGMLRGKTGKTFWFSSLGQMIQFGNKSDLNLCRINLCRTFKNYFDQCIFNIKSASSNCR